MVVFMRLISQVEMAMTMVAPEDGPMNLTKKVLCYVSAHILHFKS